MERNIDKKKKIILGILGLSILAFGLWVWLNHGKMSTDDAHIDGRVHLVSSRISGYVDSVLVEENDRVQAGQVLLRLDPSEFKVALAEAKAQLAALELNVPLERSQTGYKVSGAEAGVQGAKQRLDQLVKEELAAQHEVSRSSTLHAQTQIDLTRMRNLTATGAVSRSQLDNALTAERSAKANFEASKAHYEAISRSRAVMESEIQRLKAAAQLAGTGNNLVEIRVKQYEAQLAKVRQAELNLAWSEITAPVDGYVTKRNVEVGKMISRGQPLMAIVSLSGDDVWVTANFKETEVTDMRVGQYAEVVVDAYPSRVFKAEVDSIMSGTGSAFSLFPPENASGNYVKVVQRIPVRLRLTDYDPAKDPTLRIGMSVVPTIYVNNSMATSGDKPTRAPQSPQLTPQMAPQQPAQQNLAPAQPVQPPQPFHQAGPNGSTTGPSSQLTPAPTASQPQIAQTPEQALKALAQQQTHKQAEPVGPIAKGTRQDTGQTPGNEHTSGTSIRLSPKAMTNPSPTRVANPVQEPTTQPAQAN